MSKHAVLRLMFQLTFGWDTTIGLASFVLLSFMFREPANFWFLVWSGFCAYAPDLDFTYFLFLPKELRKWGHWRLGFHYPMLFLPLIGFIGWRMGTWLSPGHAVFVIALSVVPCFGHFVHDSTKMGLHWFAPITRDWRLSLNPLEWMHIKVTWSGLHIMTPDEVSAKYEEIARQSLGGDRSGEITTRIEQVTPAQVTCSGVCILGVVALMLLVGFVPL